MGKKVLVVDDDLYIRELYVEVLKNGGYEVASAVDGGDAIQKLKEQSFDLVFLDMLMPKVDGLGVLRELEDNLPLNKNSRIILFTNLEGQQLQNDKRLRNVSECLIKAEITPDQILASAKKLLGE
jgi:two-component system chemotaxis response regulator CheY